jgi:hypothetical protein
MIPKIIKVFATKESKTIVTTFINRATKVSFNPLERLLLENVKLIPETSKKTETKKK